MTSVISRYCFTFIFPNPQIGYAFPDLCHLLGITNCEQFVLKTVEVTCLHSLNYDRINF